MSVSYVGSNIYQDFVAYLHLEKSTSYDVEKVWRFDETWWYIFNKISVLYMPNWYADKWILLLLAKIPKTLSSAGKFMIFGKNS